MVHTRTVLMAVFFLAGLALLIEFFSPPPQYKISETHAQALVSSVSTNHPNETFTSPPSAKTIEAAFKAAGKAFYPEDEVTAIPDPALGLGSLISVKRAMPIQLKDGKKNYTIRTWASDVAGLITEQQIQLGKEDKISYPTTKALSANLKIVITRVARTTITETEVIEFQTIVENDYYTYEGSQAVKSNGENGSREKKYLLIREDGELISKTLIASKTLKAAKPKRVVRGALVWYSSRCDRYKDWAVDASLKNGINPNALYYRMFKESSCTPTSVSSAAQKYSGLLQYEPNLWVTLSAKAGYPGASIWDAKSQIYVTAWAWANGHRSRWPKDPPSF